VGIKDFTEGARRAFVFGIGGGGDILATIPTMNFLEEFGIEVLLGSLTWERIVVDSKPGPRPLSDIKNIELICDTVALASGSSITWDGIVFQACKVAKVLGRSVFLVDLNRGVKGVVRGLSELISRYDIDLVVGVDGGGDVLAKGGEPGLRSPLADMMCLSAIAQLPVRTIIGVYGFGSDGELTEGEILSRLAEVAFKGGYLGAKGLTKKDIELLKYLSKYVESEASLLPIYAAEGKMGEFTIREGTRKVYLSIISTITFYLDAKILYELSPMAKAISKTGSIIEANQILNGMGIFTELDFELLAQKLKTTSYRKIYEYINEMKRSGINIKKILYGQDKQHPTFKPN